MSSPPAERRLFFLLNAAQRRVGRWIEASMAAKGGLTAAQSGLLFYLGKADGALTGEAAEALDVAPSAMTGLVDRMVRGGLLERRTDPVDGRALRLHLTPKGREARDHAKAGLDSINAMLTEGFTPGEVEVVARWLNHLQTRFPRTAGPKVDGPELQLHASKDR